VFAGDADARIGLQLGQSANGLKHPLTSLLLPMVNLIGVGQFGPQPIRLVETMIGPAGQMLFQLVLHSMVPFQAGQK
jgi:hypothetical protein